MKPSFKSFFPYLPALTLTALSLIVALVGGVFLIFQNKTLNQIDTDIRTISSDIRKMEQTINERSKVYEKNKAPTAWESNAALKKITPNQRLYVKVSRPGNRNIRYSALNPREDVIELSKTISMR
ncbi:MAG: hypothetical protein K6B46_06355 [Opitutales bacterium]|nr:hypothetical protein [Opitutales bacterium]